MSSTSFHTSKVAAYISLIFVPIAFILGIVTYLIPTVNREDQWKVSTASGLVLSLISYATTAPIVESLINKQAEDRAEEKTAEKLKEEIESYEKFALEEYSERLHGIEEQLKQNLDGSLVEELVAKFNEPKNKIENFLVKYKASRLIVRWLDVDNNRWSLGSEAAKYAILKYNISKKYRNAFRRDIINCLTWLQDSLDNKLKAALWNRAALASAIDKGINEDLNEEDDCNMNKAIKPYLAALEFIKQSKDLRNLSSYSHVMEEFVNQLEEMYKDI